MKTLTLNRPMSPVRQILRQALVTARWAARAKRTERVRALRRALAPADIRARDEVYYGRFLNGVMILVKRNGRNTIRLW